MFDFNASHNDASPVSPMLLTVDFMKMEKNGVIVDTICVLYLLCSQFRLSLVSVVLDFNA